MAKYLLFIFSIFLFQTLFSQSNPQWEVYSSARRISDIAFHGDTLWVSTTGGISKFLPGTGVLDYYQTTNSILRKNSCGGIVVSPNGDKWIGVDYDGIYNISGNQWTYYSQRDPIFSPGLSPPMASDLNNNLFFRGLHPVTYVMGLIKYDGNQFSIADSINGLLPHGNIEELFTDYQGNVWINSSEYIFKQSGNNWTLINSFSQNSGVLTIAPNGNVWRSFELPNRIGKFDLGFWTYFDSSDYMVNASVTLIHADQAGNLWAYGIEANNVRNLLRYDGTLWTKFDTVSCPILHYNVSTISSGANGHVWFGTDNGGLYEYDGVSWTIHQVTTSYLPNEYVRGVRFDKQDNAWILTSEGYTKKHDTTFTNFLFDPILGGAEGIEIDTNGNIWSPHIYPNFYYGPAVSKFNGTNWTYFDTTSSAVFGNYGAQAIAIDNNNNKWFGTFNGLVRYDDSIFTVFNNSNSPLIDNNIPFLFADSRGNLWISLPGQNKLQRYNGTNWVTYNTTGLFPFQYTWDMANDRLGNVWGCYGGGGIGTQIGKFDGQQWSTFNPSSPAPAQYPNSIAFDHQNHLWVAYTATGLAEYDGNSWTMYTPANSPLPDDIIESLDFDRFGNLYISTVYNGLAIFNKNGIQFTNPLPEQKRISGTVFSDLNSNGIKEAGEYGLNDQRLLILPENIILTTNGNGEYSCMLDTGEYEIKILPFPNWSVSTDSLSYHFAIDSFNVSVPDFGLFAPPYHNINVSMIPGFLYCGSTTPVWIEYQNTGSVADSGKITLTVDSALDFISSVPVPTIISDSVFIWDFNNLMPFESRTIVSTFLVPYLTNISTHANVTMEIEQGLQILAVDSSQFQDSVECFDDQFVDLDVFPFGNGPQHLVSYADTLTYTLRFQNVNRDTVYFLDIIDTLDNNFDPSSLVMLGSSHSFSYTVTNKVLRFTFTNILLPDSGSNQTGSEGYVQFSILCKNTTPHLTPVYNSAHFCFDFNPQISSNIIFNTISNPGIGISEFEKEYFNIYPSPAADRVIIEVSSLENTEVLFYDITGKLLFRKLIIGQQSILDISSLNNGLYFLSLRKNNRVVGVRKIVVLK